MSSRIESEWLYFENEIDTISKMQNVRKSQNKVAGKASAAAW